MGSTDPIPSLNLSQEDVKAPPIMPKDPTTRSMTVAGTIGLTFGLIIFTWGSLAGVNLLLMGLGLVFIAAGYHSRQKAPTKLCPACRMAIPLEASVCGHCRTAQAT